jgi:uracil phosphoribosyltransferase
VELTIVDHPLAQHKLTLLRDQRTEPWAFRALVEELTMLLAFEATKTIHTAECDIETPITATKGVRLAKPAPLLVPILRAGLGMLDAMTRLIPTAEVGFVDMARNEETLKPFTYAERLPHDLTGRDCYILDPMLATGGSLGACIEFLANRNAASVTAMCILSAPEGIDYLATLTDNLNVPFTLVLAARDDRLNEHGYIVPGLGDAGDRLYGLTD